MTQPTLSIITICFENPEELDKTLQSVYPKYQKSYLEQIIIDGSRDRSCQTVLTHHPWIDLAVHEEDNGRYDAMNKGIIKASGKYLLFLNSGDYLSPECDIAQILKRLYTAESDLLFYGDAIKRVDQKYFTHQAPRSVKQSHFWKGKAPSHQAVFFPSRYCKKNPYDTSLSISADTKLMIHAFNSLRSEHLKEEIAIFSIGGVSNTWNSLSEVVYHWQQKRKARGTSAIRYAPNLTKSVIKYYLMRIIGTERYYSMSLRFRSYQPKNEGTSKTQ